MTFNLKIELGNAAMLTGEDLAKALRTVANAVEARTHEGLPGCSSGIWDTNGNKVGSWRIKGAALKGVDE